MNKKEKNSELLAVTVGEIAVFALTVLGAFVLSLFCDFAFGYTMISGAALGAAVIIFNFAFLSLSVNRAVDEYLTARGERTMTEEEAEKFTNEHSALIQNKIKLSFIIRTVSILVILALAFITKWFNPLCTVIPILAFKPILTFGEMIRKKQDPIPDPNNFVKYEENNEEKESDD